jgi:hypothetical protein
MKFYVNLICAYFFFFAEEDHDTNMYSNISYSTLCHTWWSICLSDATQKKRSSLPKTSCGVSLLYSAAVTSSGPNINQISLPAAFSMNL